MEDMIYYLIAEAVKPAKESDIVVLDVRKDTGLKAKHMV